MNFRFPSFASHFSQNFTMFSSLVPESETPEDERKRLEYEKEVERLDARIKKARKTKKQDVRVRYMGVGYKLQC